MNESERKILIERARSLYEGTDADIEVDDDASVSPSEEGTWVQAWVWVPMDDDGHGDVFAKGGT
jgi:hypothetical protein